MKERGILFSAPMVRALLAGMKTQTRRTVTSEHVADIDIFSFDATRKLWEGGVYGDGGAIAHGEWVRCPYGAVGDRLWVRETWQVVGGPEGTPERAVYRADGEDFSDWETEDGDPFRWRPSIYMPRWASRITLEVTDVRVQRLQELTEEEARSEGVEPTVSDAWEWWVDDVKAAVTTLTANPPRHGNPRLLAHYHDEETARQRFERLWNEINGERAPWSANPWVWVLTFRRVTP